MTLVLLSTSSTPLGEHELTPGETAQYAVVPGAARRRSWLVARRALRRALGCCDRGVDTSGFTMPNPLVSLTHSAELAIAAVPADPGRVAGIGVDVELDRCPDPRTARFFLTAAERRWAGDRPADLLRLWTVKEALFKADPHNAGTVLTDYVLATPRAGRGLAFGPDGRRFHYRTTRLHRGALSVALHLHPERTVMTPIDYQQVIKRISLLTSVPVARLTPDVTIAELAPDSFTFVEMAVDLQEEFDVVLSQEDLKDIVTVKDLVSALQAQQDDQAASTLGTTS
jgi:acyl carrier protein